MAKVEINKRVLDARYINWIVKYEESIGKVVEVVDIVKEILGDYFSDEEITDKFNACKVSTMMDYLIKTMKAICRIEAKTYGEIENYMAKMIADEYGVSTYKVEIYSSIRSQLNTLQRLGLVVIEDKDKNKNLYKYVGQ